MSFRHLVFATLVSNAITLVCQADQRKVSGRVLDANGNPVTNADVSPFWRANGSPFKPDGSDYDLRDPDENEEFWGNVGQMQPWQPPSKTSVDGKFSIELSSRNCHLLALNAERSHGAIVEVPGGHNAPVEIRLRPLIKVTAKMKSVLRSGRNSSCPRSVLNSHSANIPSCNASRPCWPSWTNRSAARATPKKRCIPSPAQ